MKPFYKIKTDDLDLDNVKVIKIEKDYCGFFIKRLDKEKLIEKNNFLKWLNDLFPFEAAIIKLKKNTLYKWHVDESRGVSINALISNSPSFTLFSNNIFEDGDQADFIKLEYDINKMYLFNNQIPHSVYNFDETRYLFSLEFEKDKNELSFSKLKKIIEEQYYN